MTTRRSPDVVTTIASKFVIVVVLLTFSAALFLHSQQVEATSRLDFLWKLQVRATLEQVRVTLVREAELLVGNVVLASCSSVYIVNICFKWCGYWWYALCAMRTLSSLTNL